MTGFPVGSLLGAVVGAALFAAVLRLIRWRRSVESPSEVG
jgi:hypothetical protein